MKLPWGLRWWELLPEAILAAGLLFFLVDETDAATSAFESTRAILLMVAVGVAWLTVRILLVRYTRWPALRLAVFAAGAVAVLAVVVLPAYDDTTVIETLPVVAAPTTLPPALPTPTPLPDAPTPTTAPSQPVAVRTGELRGIDHRASGRVVLYRQPDGSSLVGLEGIDIQPGPDYDVYIVPGADREDIGDGVRLDDLRGNQGTQYYDVPAGTDLSIGAWTVLVWCQTFDVPVAGATPV